MTLYKKSRLGLTIVLMLFAVSPAQALAAGTSAPQGYTYDSTTGLWQNGTYAWNPTTGQTTPLKDVDYSYNPDTQHWDTTGYRYDSTSQKYVDNQPAPTPTSTPTTQTTSPSATQSNQPNSLAAPSSGQSPTSTTTDKTTSTGLFDNFYKASISNSIGANSTSGDATVTHNTNAGDATSGAAMTTANIINLLASSLSQDGKTPYTFITNILGNVFGDLTIDPSQLAKQLPADTGNTTVNNSTDSQINNQIDLNAKSGSAAVTDNTKAGNATSGNAVVIANLINAINTSISSGQSFIGAINISGNLNGDILLPKNMLDQLLGSNASSATPDKSSSATTSADSQSINNQLELAAKSGTADISGNTSAGSATSGQAKTSLTVLNFSGHQVADANTLLVFVNVLGHWVGMIFDAPSGATAAALGGGVSSSSANSDNTTVNNSTSSQINNDLTATANSGDATVSHNTQAGNATSGDASVAVNVLNLTDSQISSANWFGVLFINILGNWFGSFGIDTAAGNQPTTSGGKGGGSSHDSTRSSQPKVFKFTPHTSNLNSYSPLSNSTLRALGSLNINSNGSSGGSSSSLSVANPQPSEANNPTVPMSRSSSEQQKDQPNWIVLSLMMSAGAVLIGRQLLLMLQRSRLRHLY